VAWSRRTDRFVSSKPNPITEPWRLVGGEEGAALGDVRPTTPTGPAGLHLVPPPNNPFRCIPPRAFCVSLSPPSRSPATGGPRPRRRRPKPGAEAFVGFFAGDEQPPGTPTPFLPFILCEAEDRNPKLKLFSYLI